MKPFDGGGWRGVSRIADAGALMQAYDSSGQSMMHLQAAIEDFDVFVRALGIGPQVQPMQYDPSQPQHARYLTNPDFLSPEKSREMIVLTKIINAFFRWELNSCEAIIKDGVVFPIDFANACPDMHLTSLHIYWPWAVKALLAWSTFCVATDRRMRLDMNTQDYFDIANSEMPWEEKLAGYEALVDEYYDTQRFDEFRATQLGWLDESMWDFVQTPDFDGILVDLVRDKFPAHEHDHFIAHYRGLMRWWVEFKRKPAGMTGVSECRSASVKCQVSRFVQLDTPTLDTRHSTLDTLTLSDTPTLRHPDTRTPMTTKKIGLLLSDEDDWPVAFEQLHARFKPSFAYHGDTLTTEVERIRIHPFNLRAPTTYDLVIDRLAYWHFHPASG